MDFWHIKASPRTAPTAVIRAAMDHLKDEHLRELIEATRMSRPMLDLGSPAVIIALLGTLV